MAAPAETYFFVSYSRRDKDFVQHVVDDLIRQGINIWLDSRQLYGGDNWRSAITSALQGAAGVIVFLSPASMSSSYVMSEVESIATRQLPIIPVLLEPTAGIPDNLAEYQWIDMTDPDRYEQAFSSLMDALHFWIESDTGLESTASASRSANLVRPELMETAIANRAADLAETSPPPKSVFIVHGHDHDFLDEVKQALTDLEVLPIVLSEEENQESNLFEKFWQHSGKAEFAVVLVSSDDLGAALREYNEVDFDGNKVRDGALKFRARQNVILELGFFYGRLGTERVLVLQKHSGIYHPPFERPSDLDGRLFEEADPDGKWKQILRAKLEEQKVLT